MEYEGIVKPFPPSVLGQWRNGNILNARKFKTVYALFRVYDYPPGDYVGVKYISRSRYQTGQVIGSVKMVLVGTSATKEECQEWASKQEVFDIVDIDLHANRLFRKETSVKPIKDRQHVQSGTYNIDNDILLHEVDKLGIPISELAIKYNCTYHNLYNRLNRYRAKLKNLNMHLTDEEL